jgi:hypothetical protein
VVLDGGRPFRGAGNSFFSTGDFTISGPQSSTSCNNGRRSQLLYCVRILRNVCEADAQGAVRANLGVQGALVTFVAFLCRNFPQAPDQFDIRIRTDLLLLVSTLCEYDAHNKVCQYYYIAS